MDNKSLIFSGILLVIPIYISFKQKLGLEKEIIYSVIRAIIQLLIIGYILKFIFGLKNPIVTISLIIIMVFNASLNIKKRGKGINNAFFIAFLSIGGGTLITVTILVITKAIKFTPEDLIPVSGMVISNIMVSIGLSFNGLKERFKRDREEIEVKLSLGADEKLTSDSIIRETVKMAIMPTIESAKTLGIVALPGMMTGLILAGQSPLTAIKFQMMVTFMLISGTSIGSIICIYLSYKTFYTKRKTLKFILE